MAFKEYDVEIGGIVHTMQLSEADADRRGLLNKPVEDPKSKATKPSGK